MKKIFAIVALLILLLAVAGCKEDASAKKTVTRTTTTSGTAADNAAADDSANAEPETNTDGSDSSGYMGLLTKYAGLKYTVTYDITSKADGQSNKVTMTQYFGGESKVRMDTKTPQGDTRMYMLDKTVYSCMNQGGWQCMKLTSGEEQAQNPSNQLTDIKDNIANYKITGAGTMTIAGTVAACYTVVSADGTYKQCFSKEGVPLYMQVKTGTSESEMKATSYKASVASGDFTLPAEAQDLSAMMEKYKSQVPSGYGQ